MCLIFTSSRFPVASFRYLAMNGIVPPSSSNLMVISTRETGAPTSLLILRRISELNMTRVSNVCQNPNAAIAETFRLEPNGVKNTESFEYSQLITHYSQLTTHNFSVYPNDN